ncbi:MAG TPA: methionyl-tRNA formyltransferase [Candidatus Acidoferrum sp.]|nr:methionyl-tRNA formyltransferase [Candidatus Acidoferrum sp.]
MALRLVFCGTPEFALPSLRRLIADSNFQIEAVVTQPDRPRGRGHQVAASPVKEFALASGSYLYQPERMRSESAELFLKRMAPEAVVIIAYGQIIPANLLTVPRLGWVNLHASLLPKYRGAAPINWAIVNGEKVTGLTTMQVDAGMDTGPILMQHEMEIGPEETAPELSQRMAEAGAPLVVDSLLGLVNGTITPRAQDSTLATRAPILKKEHGLIDWTLSAAEISNRIRGFEPWPGAYTFFRGQHCQVWGRELGTLPTHVLAEYLASDAGQAQNISSSRPGAILPEGDSVVVACGGKTYLALEAVKLEGRGKVHARDFVNGARLKAGELFAMR